MTHLSSIEGTIDGKRYSARLSGGRIVDDGDGTLSKALSVPVSGLVPEGSGVPVAEDTLVPREYAPGTQEHFDLAPRLLHQGGWYGAVAVLEDPEYGPVRMPFGRSEPVPA